MKDDGLKRQRQMRVGRIPASKKVLNCARKGERLVDYKHTENF